ncbi:hypothetical protein CFOL_v3_28920, partial [Cephalotus follicularis]
VLVTDFNIYVFKGLKPKFKDLVTTLSARIDPITYFEMLGLLLSHEFLHGDPLNTITISSTVSPPTTNVPSANLSQRSNSTPSRGRGRNSQGRGRRRGNDDCSTSSPGYYPPNHVFESGSHLRRMRGASRGRTSPARG